MIIDIIFLLRRLKAWNCDNEVLVGPLPIPVIDYKLNYIIKQHSTPPPHCDIISGKRHVMLITATRNDLVSKTALSSKHSSIASHYLLLESLLQCTPRNSES